MVKKYGQSFPISNVKICQTVMMAGKKMYVHEISDMLITLSSSKDKLENEKKLNQAQFDHDVQINESHVLSFDDFLKI